MVSNGKAIDQEDFSPIMFTLNSETIEYNSSKTPLLCTIYVLRTLLCSIKRPYGSCWLQLKDEKNNTHITINNFDSLLQKGERSYFVQT